MTNPAETIQRYAYFPEHVMPRIQGCHDGKWVKYVDHIRILAAALAEVERVRKLAKERDDELFEAQQELAKLAQVTGVDEGEKAKPACKHEYEQIGDQLVCIYCQDGWKAKG